MNEKLAELINSILKDIRDGKEPKHWDEYITTRELWNEAAEYIKENHLVDNVGIARGGRGNKILTVHYNNCNITERGEIFIGLAND